MYTRAGRDALLKMFLLEPADVDRSAQLRRPAAARVFRDALSVDRNQFAGFVYPSHVEALQIVHHRQSRQVARHDRADAAKAEVLRRVEARQPHGQARVHAGGDGATNDMVHLAFAQQIVDVLVVGAEAKSVRVFAGDQRQQSVEIAGLRAFANHDHQPAAQLLASLLERRTLMVAVDSRRNVSRKILAAQARSVPVDDLIAGHANLVERLLVSRDHRGEVHHLGQP